MNIFEKKLAESVNEAYANIPPEYHERIDSIRTAAMGVVDPDNTEEFNELCRTIVPTHQAA